MAALPRIITEDENRRPENREILMRTIRCPANLYKGKPDQHVFAPVPASRLERCACGLERDTVITCPHCQCEQPWLGEAYRPDSIAPNYLTIPGPNGLFFTGCLECWLERAAALQALELAHG